MRFSFLKLGIKIIYPYLGITVKINVRHRIAAALGFGVPIPAADSTNTTASKNCKRGDQDTKWILGLEKVACSNTSPSPPASGSAVTDSSSESVTSFPILKLVHLQVAG